MAYVSYGPRWQLSMRQTHRPGEKLFVEQAALLPTTWAARHDY